MGRVQKPRQTLAERLIHKVCSERHANLARRLFIRVYETFPFTPLLFPLRELPESPRDDELAERRIFDLVSVGFFDLETLQFAAQGDDLVGIALIIFL